MIKFDNVNISFNDKNVYATPINLEISAGEFICIIGQSGTGKSVLLKMLLGNLKPTQGNVYINNQQVKKPSKNISVVYQDHFILPWMTLRNNILLGQPTSSAVYVNEIAQKLKIDQYLDLFPNAVSIGTKQRASIARALLADTDIVAMDEPLSSVDEITSAHIRTDIAELCKQKTTICVTHNLTEALQLSSRIVVVGRQGIVANFTRNEVNSIDMLLRACSH